MLFPDATLLLIGHGSTVNDDSAMTVHQHANALRLRGEFADIRVAFFKIEPCIGAALADIRTPRVIVVPLFASEGYFTLQAIPCELGLPPGSQETMPCKVSIAGRELVYCQPVGTHELITEIILVRAKQAVASSGTASHIPYSAIALVIAGHGTPLSADSRKSIERQVQLITGRQLFAEVHAAFLEEEPRIAEIHNLVSAPTMVVVPFFMSDGLHVCEDIPVLLGESKANVQARLKAGEWPWRNPTNIRSKTIFYTRGVGSEPGIAEVILERVRSATALL